MTSTPDTLRWWADQIRKCTREFYFSHVLVADLNYGADEIEELQTENAKLRTFLDGGSIVIDYWKDEDGTMHVLTTDGEHTYEYMRGGLADENAKLRKLVCDFDKCLTEAVRLAYIQGHATIYDSTLLDSLHPRMRELGIEVEG